MSTSLAAAFAVLFAAAGCATAEPDTADRERIAVMRADPIFAHVIDDPEAGEGSEKDGTFVPNTYTAPLDPWFGGEMPVGPTVAQRKSAIANLVITLRTDGWNIISARCHDPVDDTDVQDTATPSADTVDSHQWEVFGYRLRDGVPYTVHLESSFAEPSGFGVRVAMASPFHADTSTYFGRQPLALPEEATCVEQPENAEANQGSIWSLDAARG